MSRRPIRQLCFFRSSVSARHTRAALSPVFTRNVELFLQCWTSIIHVDSAMSATCPLYPQSLPSSCSAWVMRHDAILTARLIRQRIDLIGQQKTNIDLGHPEVLGLGRDGLPAVLDSFSHFPHINTRLVHISRVVGRHRHGD